jgi:hypothetical protein
LVCLPSSRTMLWAVKDGGIGMSAVSTWQRWDSTGQNGTLATAIGRETETNKKPPEGGFL